MEYTYREFQVFDLPLASVLLQCHFCLDEFNLFSKIHSRAAQNCRNRFFIQTRCVIFDTHGLLRFIELENDLSDLLGVRVDLVMRRALRDNVEREILREAVAI